MLQQFSPSIPILMTLMATHPATMRQDLNVGFISEKFKGGKSGVAACSYEAEKVFSAPGEKSFPANEHCQTEPVRFGYTDLENVRIDLSENKVTWDQQFGYFSFDEPDMIEFIMRREKITKEEATKRVKGPF